MPSCQIVNKGHTKYNEGVYWMRVTYGIYYFVITEPNYDNIDLMWVIYIYIYCLLFTMLFFFFFSNLHCIPTGIGE